MKLKSNPIALSEYPRKPMSGNANIFHIAPTTFHGIKRVSNTGRHKIVDTECNGGNIKILSNASTEIPSGSAHITFNQKYTYVYGDNWIIE